MRVSSDTIPSIESILLQRLIAEIESRQLVRPQPTYVIDQPPPKQSTLIRTLCALVWVLSMAVCIVSVKYIDSQSAAPQAAGPQSQSMESLAASMSDQKKEFSAMADSLHTMADAIALNAGSTAAISGILNRFSTNLQQVHAAPQTRTPVDLTPPPAGPAPESDVSQIPMGGHHHAPLSTATVAPEGATVHYNSLGVMDYWLVPRVVSGVRSMAKVVPISQNNGASFIHDVAEARDYIVTPSGEWIAVSETGAK
ncbi:MAG: hypothetical protein JO340_09040 [Acidobacteriaceae bacterium]|nr:hypothetical protein [Acidobacteriaceae bacterium]